MECSEASCDHEEDRSLTLRTTQQEERSHLPKVTDPPPKCLPLEFLRSVNKESVSSISHPSQLSVTYGPNVTNDGCYYDGDSTQL